MSLAQLPEAKDFQGKSYINVERKDIDDVLRELEDKGWMWNNGFKPTDLLGCFNYNMRFDLNDKKITWNIIMDKNPIFYKPNQESKCTHDFIPLFNTICCKYCGKNQKDI